MSVMRCARGECSGVQGRVHSRELSSTSEGRLTIATPNMCRVPSVVQGKRNAMHVPSRPPSHLEP